MENLKNELNAQENAPISDEELNAVSGGRYSDMLGYGNMSTSYQIATGKLKTIDGSVCPTCQGNEGFLDVAQDGSLYLKCATCGDKILSPFRSEAIEFAE